MTLFLLAALRPMQLKRKINFKNLIKKCKENKNCSRKLKNRVIKNIKNNLKI